MKREMIKKNKKGIHIFNQKSYTIFPYSKRGQLTIFIILALAIVAVLVLILLRRPDFSVVITPKTPLEDIKDCATEALDSSSKYIALQGGSIEPKNYYLYNGTKVEYLCYSSQYYDKCIMQKPLLKDSFQNEIEKDLNLKIKDCFEFEKDSLEKKGYSVSYKISNISAELVPKNILLRIDGELKIAKDKTETYKTIKIAKTSKLYELVMITTSILNWEARYGESEILSYMMYYPELRVEKKKQDDGTTIYIITDKETKEQFMFAAKSFVAPVGVTGK